MAQQTGQEVQHPAHGKALAEALCDLEIPKTIRFSPDGEKVLYATSLDSNHRKGKHPVSTLWLASTATADSSRQLTSGLYEDNAARWHPDGNRIVFLSDRAKPGESAAVWILRLDGGDPSSLTPVENTQSIDTLSISPNGEIIAFTSADEKSSEMKEKEDNDETEAEVWDERWDYARLRLVDIGSKKIRTLVGGDRHITDAAWSPNGESLVFQSNRNPEIEETMLTGTTISTVNVESGHVIDLCTLHNEIEDLTWAPDGKIYFITGAPDNKESGGRAVYVIDPEATATPVHAKAAYGEEDDAIAIRVRGEDLVVSRMQRLSTVIGKLGKDVLFRKETDIWTWDIFFDANSGEATLAAGISSINNPYEVCIVKGDDSIQVSNLGAVFKDREFGSYRVLTCPSSDGEVELDGLYLTPTTAKVDDNGTPTSPLPTFVMIHGGPTDRNCNAFDAYYYCWAPYILSKGYGVLLPQYRGGWGRGEKFASYSMGGLGKYDYDDVITITTNAVSKGYADGSKLIVGGWSQGGFLTYLCIVRNGLHGQGWRFNAAIPGAGICDIDSLCLTGDLGSTYDAELNDGNVAWTMDHKDTSNRQGSALWEVAGAVAEGRRLGQPVIPPVLILHGKEDVRCPFSQSVGFRRALRAHGLPCEFVAYPRQPHSLEEQRFWIDMLERIGRWCDKYIGDGKEEATLTVDLKPKE